MTDLYKDQQKSEDAVECFGIRFPSNAARRSHFRLLLKEMLENPEFRQVDGFPSATDEAILAMSDPPYYTACPNPFFGQFIKHFGKPYDSSLKYSREPLTVDVSVGKTDALYKAHAYHTKVPHLAIVPSILHYTEPGDIILDGFAGSGMTGVAAQWCGSAPATYRHELEMERKGQGKVPPAWGARRVILNDLSPAATFIASNFNIPFDVEEFAEVGRQLLNDADAEIGWMYQTLHVDGSTVGRIEYTVWSEIFTCPECAGEVNFLAEALDKETERVRESFPCPHCGAILDKDKLERVLESRVDPATGQPWKRIKFDPAFLVYAVDGARFKKTPDAADFEVLRRIESLTLPHGVPTDRFPIEKMYHGSRIAPKGFSSVHHFYLPRAAHALAWLWDRARRSENLRTVHMLQFFVEQGFRNFSVLNAFEPLAFSQNARGQKGLYYVPSQHSEVSPWYFFTGKLKGIEKAARSFDPMIGDSITSTGSATKLLQIPDRSIDYVFTDPPFGENIFYADLNFLVEAWHGVTTNAVTEAIVDKFKGKALPEYQHLMRQCFEEYFRVLKPGRWMTVVFSNSKAAVWNAIQVALQQAGFVVAEVTALDKGQGSYRQVTSATAVKQDLVISAYKPNGGLEDRFAERGASEDSAWDFTATHLRNLPVIKVTQGTMPELVNVVERDPRRVYDRMAAWFIRHGTLVPISTPEFLAGLEERYKVIDGMVFLPDQVAEYEKARNHMPQIRQAELFVSDERSAIDWLTNFLQKRPSTRAEIHPEYIPQIGAAKKKGEIIPELDQLLEDNFIQFDGKGDVPNQISNWLSKNFHEFRGLTKDDARLVAKAKDRWYVPDPSKAQDLEKKRDKALLKEFERYVAATSRKLKDFRLEVLRGGFKAAWAAKDYATIIKVAHKLPEEALQEDEKLLTLYDMALTRSEAGG
jgi:DNA modification methylase